MPRPSLLVGGQRGREPRGGRRYNAMVHSAERGEVTLRVTRNSVVCAAAENALSPGCANTRISGSVFPLMCHSVSSAKHPVLSLAGRADFWHLEDPHEGDWRLFHPLPTCVPLHTSFRPPQRLRPESRGPWSTNSENKPRPGGELGEGLPPGSEEGVGAEGFHWAGPQSHGTKLMTK